MEQSSIFSELAKEMENNRIRKKIAYVAGDSIYSPLGFSTEENMRAIYLGKSAIHRVCDPLIFSKPFNGAKIEKEADFSSIADNGENFTLLEKRIIYSIEDAIKSSGLSPELVKCGKTRLIIATTKGNIDLLEGKCDNIDKRAYLGELALRISRYMGLKQKPLVVSNACISGISALITAARLIEYDECDNVIVAGADLMTKFVVSGFEAFHSISETVCTPYDVKRDGLSLGEAAGTIILTSLRSILADNDPIVIEGGSVTNDSNHLSAPSRTGDGLGEAMLTAMAEARISGSSVDFVNAHGTATIYNDEMESRAIHWASLMNVPVQSLKPYWGHTLGASGVIESIASFWQIKNSLLIGTKGFNEAGVPMEIKVSPHHRECALSRCVKSASGFGGCNAAIVFAKESVSNYPGTGREEKWSEVSSFKLTGEVNFDTIIRDHYKEMEMKDIKFFKMDDLSKLGVIATARLLCGFDSLDKYSRFERGFFMANSVSSLESDIKHQRITEKEGDLLASPAVFVYTLPNIVLGESAIRNKFQGENSFFVADASDKSEIMGELLSLAQKSSLKLVVAGWCEFLNGNFDVDLKLYKRE
jgi:3-oxoacyl-(acyl-carrier-protein) synthase